jgi:hypothetical protein
MHVLVKPMATETPANREDPTCLCPNFDDNIINSTSLPGIRDVHVIGSICPENINDPKVTPIDLQSPNLQSRQTEELIYRRQPCFCADCSDGNFTVCRYTEWAGERKTASLKWKTPVSKNVFDPVEKETFQVGDVVEYLWDNMTKNPYYKGIVTDVGEDGLYSIDFDDGDQLQSIEGKYIRLFKAIDAKEILKCRHGSNGWYFAQMVRYNAKDGTYQVKYIDDGMIEYVSSAV